MTLKLVMIRCPDHAVPEQREVKGGEFSIGRGHDNEWVLADPERHLSKRHCRLSYVGGEWEVQDLSANGTFLNQSADPLGRDASRKLHSGDRIKFGQYEIEVSIEHDDQAGRGRRGQGEFVVDDAGNEKPGLFELPSDFRRPQESASDDGRSLLDPGINNSVLPPDFDPLAPGPESFPGPTQSDHAPAIDSAFRPRQTTLPIIPEDWNVEQPPVPGPAPARGAAPVPGAATAPRRVTPMPSTGDGPAPAIARQPAQAAAPVPSDSAILAAFLRGAGLDGLTLADPEKTLERIGGAMRATVSGLRQTLMARASIKDEFRIEQTLIRPTGNNPLKFSVDDDDAMTTLLGVGRRGTMKPEQAIAEAFENVRMHELATISAMQSAVRVLLAQFEPDTIEHKVAANALHILPAQRKADAWEAFALLHASVTQALSDDFDSVFGRAFARAYEQAIDGLSAPEAQS